MVLCCCADAATRGEDEGREFHVLSQETVAGVVLAMLLIFRRDDEGCPGGVRRSTRTQEPEMYSTGSVIRNPGN